MEKGVLSSNLIQEFIFLLLFAVAPPPSDLAWGNGEVGKNKEKGKGGWTRAVGKAESSWHHESHCKTLPHAGFMLNPWHKNSHDKI